jgi:hypothetical protein
MGARRMHVHAPLRWQYPIGIGPERVRSAVLVPASTNDADDDAAANGDRKRKWRPLFGFIG